LEVGIGDSHRGGQRRSVGPFTFDADAAAVLEQQQVNLGSLVRGPEIGLVGAEGFEHLFDRKSFPRSADFGMRLQAAAAGDSKQRVQEAAVSYEDLGSLHLALAEILE